jgi:hypothetical protein
MAFDEKLAARIKDLGKWVDSGVKYAGSLPPK